MRIPKRPASPQCCGQISCIECLKKWLQTKPTCPHCRTACKISDILMSPFVSTKLSGISVRCPNHRGMNGCTRMISFGREGSRLMEHIAICDEGLVTCKDCKELMFRREMVNHRPSGDANGGGKGPCPHMPKRCEICNITILYSDVNNHNNSTLHYNNVMSRFSSVVTQMRNMEMDMKTQQLTTTNLRKKISDTKKDKEKVIGFNQQILIMKTEHEKKIEEVCRSSIMAVVEFEIDKWSDIKTDASIYSISKPLRKWGHTWWLKVNKSVNHIGVYLCCGEEGSFPITVEYQLLVRRRHCDEYIEHSSYYTAEFGREKAWGIVKFTTIETLEKEGAYSRSEDRLTFGCNIYPGKGLLWGQPSSRSSSSTL